MTSRYGTRSPRPVASAAGRGPAVRAQHCIRLNARRGFLESGFLGEHYQPCPPGASVVLDCGPIDVMTVDTARNIARSLARCSEITVTGTAERGERGYVDDFGLIFGLDAIANTVSRYAHEFAMELRT